MLNPGRRAYSKVVQELLGPKSTFSNPAHLFLNLRQYTWHPNTNKLEQFLPVNSTLLKFLLTFMWTQFSVVFPVWGWPETHIELELVKVVFVVHHWNVWLTKILCPAVQ